MVEVVDSSITNVWSNPLSLDPKPRTETLKPKPDLQSVSAKPQTNLNKFQKFPPEPWGLLAIRETVFPGAFLTSFKSGEVAA